MTYIAKTSSYLPSIFRSQHQADCTIIPTFSKSTLYVPLHSRDAPVAAKPTCVRRWQFLHITNTNYPVGHNGALFRGCALHGRAHWSCVGDIQCSSGAADRDLRGEKAARNVDIVTVILLRISMINDGLRTILLHSV